MSHASTGFDLEDERALVAREMAAVAWSMARLADLVGIVEPPPLEVGGHELNAMAERLHHWAVDVAKSLLRPALVDELEGRELTFARWRALQEQLGQQSPQAQRGGGSPLA
jgi:hypothetical protein